MRADFWKDSIENMRETYSRKRKFFLSHGRQRFWLDASWMKYSDELMGMYSDQGLLYKEGRLVYSHIVQANDLLFSKGSWDLPANVIFSEDPFFDSNPDILHDIAADAFQLKGRQLSDSPELQSVGDMLANEMGRVFNVRLPETLAQGREVYLTTAVIHRKHLPNRYLDSPLLPLLVLPEKTKHSVLLPVKFWSRAIVGLCNAD